MSVESIVDKLTTEYGLDCKDNFGLFTVRELMKRSAQAAFDEGPLCQEEGCGRKLVFGVRRNGANGWFCPASETNQALRQLGQLQFPDEQEVPE